MINLDSIPSKSKQSSHKSVKSAGSWAGVGLQELLFSCYRTRN